MAFLTQYNFSQLSKKVEIKIDIDLKTFQEYVFNDPQIFYILNKTEIEYLFKYAMLLKDEKKFFVEYYNNVPEKIDTKTHVFNKGGKVKYHISKRCKLINKDYLDFEIPSDIIEISKKQGTDFAIEEYRDWFTNNKFAEKFRNHEIDANYIIRAFNLKYPSKYGIKSVEENSRLLIIEAKNTGEVQLDNIFDKEGCLKHLDEEKKQWQNAFQCKVSRIIAKHKYLDNKPDEEIHKKMTELFSENFIINYGIANLKDKFRLSKKYTYRIIDLLLSYLKWQYKLNEKDLDVITLEQFGLECCHLCKKKEQDN